MIKKSNISMLDLLSFSAKTRPSNTSTETYSEFIKIYIKKIKNLTFLKKYMFPEEKKTFFTKYFFIGILWFLLVFSKNIADVGENNGNLIISWAIFLSFPFFLLLSFFFLLFPQRENPPPPPLILEIFWKIYVFLPSPLNIEYASVPHQASS